MSEFVASILVAIAIIVCAIGCLCLAGSLRNTSTQIEVTYTSNPVAVAQSPPPTDEPEDPIDFSSNPKSSSVNVGS